MIVKVSMKDDSYYKIVDLHPEGFEYVNLRTDMPCVACLFMNITHPHLIVMTLIDTTIFEWDIPLDSLEPSIAKDPMDVLFYVPNGRIDECQIYDAQDCFGLRFKWW